jgi:hypothetical protein
MAPLNGAPPDLRQAKCLQPPLLAVLVTATATTAVETATTTVNDATTAVEESTATVARSEHLAEPARFSLDYGC